jgi:prepilin-type N-terminal cleavage/methylation domain-containing protein
MTASRRNGGFTLVEMLIAITVLAIVASVALTSSEPGQTRALESAARFLAADLRLARSLSIQHNTEYTARFDTAGNRYELVHTGSGNPPPLENPLASRAENAAGYRIEFGRAGLAGGANTVRLTRVFLESSGRDVTDVTFGPQGGTGPARADNTLMILTAGSGRAAKSLQVTVSWVTGLVWIDTMEKALP